jgi:hypothetical protein
MQILSPFHRKSGYNSVRRTVPYLAVGLVAAQSLGIGGAPLVDAWAQEPEQAQNQVFQNQALQGASEAQVKELWSQLQRDSAELEATNPKAAIARYQGFFESGAGRFPSVAIPLALRIARIWQFDLRDTDKAIEIYDWALALYKDQPGAVQLQRGRLAAVQAQKKAEGAKDKKALGASKVPGSASLTVPVPKAVGGGKLAVSTPSTGAPKATAVAVPHLAPRGNALGWKPGADRCITALARQKRGRLWVATEDAGVWYCDPGAPLATRWKQFLGKDGLGDDSAYALAVDGNNRVWVGTLNHGVSVWNGKAWKNYGVLDGPLGERVFDIAVCPTDGDVWIATNAGLTRYSASKDTWSYVTRADGLPSNQVQAIAFDRVGNLIVGTQCDGIGLSSAEDSYKTWKVVTGPNKMPTTPTGSGLPTSLINDVLVAADGTIYAGTTTGLAWSRDAGKSWSYVRGKDYAAKVRGLFSGVPLGWAEGAGAVLSEDYVSCLAQDARGHLLVGHWQTGSEVLEMMSGPTGGVKSVIGQEGSGLVRAILPLAGDQPLQARYDEGLAKLSFGSDSSDLPIISSTVQPVAASVNLPTEVGTKR